MTEETIPKRAAVPQCSTRWARIQEKPSDEALTRAFLLQFISISVLLGEIQRRTFDPFFPLKFRLAGYSSDHGGEEHMTRSEYPGDQEQQHFRGE